MKQKINDNYKIILVCCAIVATIGVVANTGFSYAVGNQSNQIYTRDELSAKIEELESNITESSLFLKVYPIGSIYTSINSTNPETTYGGTWVAFGTGKTLVGVDSTQSSFNNVEKTGGSSTINTTHTHTYSWSGTHRHETPLSLLQFDYNTGTYYIATNEEFGIGPAYTSGYKFPNSVYLNYTLRDTAIGNGYVLKEKERFYNYYTQYSQINVSGTTSQSGSATQSVQNPYITVYMWKRTA